MTTPYSTILEVVDTYRGEVVISDTLRPRIVVAGTIDAGIMLEKEFTTNSTNQTITPDMTQNEIHLTGLCALKAFASGLHWNYTSKAQNLKTMTFALAGATERAKEMGRIVEWCEKEIKRY
jgi:hypothetical protein